MEFEKNTLLFGTDPTPRIVAIELGETGTVKVYRREPDGSTIADVEPFHPFVWCDSDVVDLGIESENLQSNLKYGWLVTVDSWKELIALRNGLKNAGRDFFALTDPVQHYLTATGRTLFKDLPFEELKRMQIEVLSFENAVAGVDDPSWGDHIMSVALSDNTGWEELLVVDPKNVDESEHAALKRLTAIIKERDPDVIKATICSVSICRIWSHGRREQRPNSIGAVVMDSYARGRHDSKSRKKQSIIRSSQSVAAISLILFCSLNFMTSACVLSQDSNAQMSPGISNSAIANQFQRLPGRNYNAPILAIRKCSSDERCAVFVKRVLYRIFSARATSFRRKSFLTITKT